MELKEKLFEISQRPSKYTSLNGISQGLTCLQVDLKYAPKRSPRHHRMQKTATRSKGELKDFKMKRNN